MHRKRLTPLALSLMIALAFGSTALAQDSSLSVATSPDWGDHLVDAEGMSLYLYTNDMEGEIACVDACVNNWPPLLMEEGTTLGEGVDESLVDSVERPDGTQQVTYGGNPLYRYARDMEAGQTNGQGLGGAFFLVSPAGESIEERGETQRVELDPELHEALMSEGEPIYASQCAMCHAADGAGQIGPSLRENDLLGNTQFLVGRILNGFPEHGMPPFRGQLSDRQIAAVSTFIRNSWGNDFGGVTEEEVSDLR